MLRSNAASTPRARVAWLWPQRSPPVGWVKAPCVLGGARLRRSPPPAGRRRRCACSCLWPGPRSSSACRGWPAGSSRRALELRRRGPVADRVEAWHVDALVRLAEGNRLGAQRAARTGLRLLEEHQAALAASDLRAAVSEIGVEIARLGLRIALADDAGDSVLAWAERLRASALAWLR